MKQENSYNDNHVEEDMLAGRLIKQSAIDKAPDNLTDMIMGKIDFTSRPAETFRPIISSKVWALIAIVISSLFLLILMAPPSKKTGSSSMDQFSGFLKPAIDSISSMIPESLLSESLLFVVLGIFTIFLFILIDYSISNYFNAEKR